MARRWGCRGALSALTGLGLAFLLTIAETAPGELLLVSGTRFSSLNLGPVLTWDGSVNNWGSSHWLGSPPTYPDSTYDAIVPSGKVTVEANHAAYSLTIQGGEVVVGSSNRLTIETALTVPSGNLSMGAGATLSASSGFLKFYTSAGNSANFVKNGAGILTLDNTAGGISAAGTTFQLNQGTLQGIGANPLGGAEEVILAGGRLALEGVASLSYGAIKERLFDDITGDETLDPIASGSGFLARGDYLYEGMLTGELAFNGDHWHNAPGNFSAIDRNGWDGIGGLWFGTMRVGAPDSGAPLEAGTMTLATNSDDGSVWWVDVNQNHRFEPGELIVNNKGWHATQWRTGVITLAEGDYDIALGFYEGSGEEWMEARWGQGDQSGNPAGMNLVNPAAQSQLWVFKEYGPLNLPNTNITVTADSEVYTYTDSYLTRFGRLNLQSGTTLSTSGSPMEFQSTEISGGAGRWAALSVNNRVDIGTYNDQSVPSTFIKRGTGTMVVDNTTTGNIQASATTWRVEGGQLHALGANPLGGAEEVILAGGRVTLEGAASVTSGVLKERLFDDITGDATLDPIGSGSGFLARGDYLYEGMLTGELAFDGDHWHNAPGNFGAIGRDGKDWIGGLWFGTMRVGAPDSGAPLEAGTMTLATNSDDGSVWWVDVNQNHLFEPGELIVNNKGTHGTQWRTGVITLAEGDYDIALGFYEGNGGEWMEARWGQGDQRGNPAGMNLVNPATQSQLWVFKEYGPLNLPSTNITVTADSELHLVSDSYVRLGTLTLQDGTTLSLLGASTSFQSTGISGEAGRSAGLDHSNRVDIGTYNDQGVPSTFIKRGSGTMLVDNTTTGNIQASATTWRVEGGQLHAIGANPLGGAEEVILAGGTLTLQGTPVTVENALRGSIFFSSSTPSPWGPELRNPMPSNETPMNLEGARFQESPIRVFIGDKNGTILTMAEASTLNVLVRESTQNWTAWAGLFDGNTDQFITALSGQFIPKETGTYNFHWNNDDAGLMYIDLNGDHQFQSEEKVAGYGWNMNGNVSLVADTAYDVIYMAREYGGGQSVWWAFTPPSGGERIVNPGANFQTGTWRTLASSAISMTDTPITVVANSRLQIMSDFGAELGPLTLQDGSILSLSGPPTHFQSTGISGEAGRSAGLDHSNRVDIGTYNDQSVPSTFIKRGSGTMLVDNTTTGNIQASATSWRVEGGLFHPLGNTPLGGSSTVILAGGQVQLDGPVTYIPGLLAGSHSGNMWTGGPNPGNLGIVLGPQGLRYETELRNAHWCAERADGGTGPDNTTLIYSGEIYLAGPTTFVEQNDDISLLTIEGQQVLYDTNWNNAVSGLYIPPGPGWYRFEVRFSNGGGGYGFSRQQDTSQGDSNWDQVSFGFGIAPGVVVGENALNYTYPEDPGNASLFRVSQYEAIQQPNLHIGVDGGGTLMLNSPTSAVLGTLTFKQGTLLVTGAPNGVQFTGGGGVDAAATQFALTHSMPITIAGPYDGQHATASFTKLGTGTLTFREGTHNHEGVSLEVKEGEVVTQGPIQVANLKIRRETNVHTGTYNLTLSPGGRFQAGNVKITTSTAPMQMGGDDLASGPQRMVLQGGTVTVRNAVHMPDDLVLWLDASQITGMQDGDPVTNWPDQSGQGHDLNNHSGSPSYIAAGLNDLPVVRFDTTDGTDALWSSFNFDAYPAYTIFALQHYTGEADGRITTSRTRNWFFGHHDSHHLRWYAEGWIIDDGDDNTNWHLYAGTITDDADPVANFWADGTQLVSNNTGSGNGNHTIGQLQLGAWGGGLSEPSNAEIAEILIFGRVLDSWELTNVSGYLNTKYALERV